MTDTKFLVLLGKRIKDLRAQRNMSQNQLAILCDFEKANLSRIETGKTNLTILTLRKICVALNIELREVFP